MRRMWPLGLAAAALAVTGCYPESVGREGRQINDLYRIFFAGGIVVAAIVWGLTTWALLRYRRRDDRLPNQTHGNNVIEVIWTAIPLVTVLVLFGLTYGTLESMKASASEPGVQVHVVGFRWQWRFEYTDQGVTIIGDLGGSPQLVVPTDEAIHVTVTATDVPHSFYVPALLYKMDAIPGRINNFDFRVEVAGTYPGVCAELCGVYHDRMLFSVRAVPRSDFDAWLATARSQGQPIIVGPSTGGPSGSPGAPGGSTQPSNEFGAIPSASPGST